MKKEKMSASRLFNFAAKPTCPICGSTNCVITNRSKKLINNHDYFELINLKCEECKHRWTLRFNVSLVGYKPGAVFNETSGVMEEQPEQKITK